MSGIKAVFGSAGIGRNFAKEELPALYEILERGNCDTIDTAALYGESEQLLGETHAYKKFTIDTKTKGGFAGSGYGKFQARDAMMSHLEHSHATHSEQVEHLERSSKLEADASR